MKIKSRIQLRKSAKNKLLSELEETFGDSFKEFKNSKFETVTIDDFKLVLIDGRKMLFSFEDRIFPTVEGALEMDLKNNVVTVDTGAVKFVASGADIMSPGIVEADSNIKKGDLVVIKEEAHGKPLAIGRALVSGADMVADSGKAIKSLHYVGDKIWKLEI